MRSRQRETSRRFTTIRFLRGGDGGRVACLTGALGGIAGRSGNSTASKHARDCIDDMRKLPGPLGLRGEPSAERMEIHVGPWQHSAR